MKTIKYKLEDLTCPSCITTIAGLLSKEKGVEKAKVLFNSRRVKVAYDENKTSSEFLGELIENLGYPVISIK